MKQEVQQLNLFTGLFYKKVVTFYRYIGGKQPYIYEKHTYTDKEYGEAMIALYKKYPEEYTSLQIYVYS